MDNGHVLTEGNWRDAVLAAIRELPGDIRSSVGWYQPTDHLIVIRVACEPLPGEDTEAHVTEVKVQWWNTRREELEALMSEAPYLDIEETLKFEAGRRNSVIDQPSISVSPGEAGGAIESPVPGRAVVGLLKGVVQEKILEELFAGGGQSLVSKDKKGQFIRADGTYILEWQRTKRRRGRG